MINDWAKGIWREWEQIERRSRSGESLERLEKSILHDSIVIIIVCAFLWSALRSGSHYRSLLSRNAQFGPMAAALPCDSARRRLSALKFLCAITSCLLGNHFHSLPSLSPFRTGLFSLVRPTLTPKSIPVLNFGHYAMKRETISFSFAR